MTAKPRRIFLGMDIGGTKTAVVAKKEGTTVSKTISFSTHGANFNAVGATRVVGLIAATIARIRAEEHEPCSVACVAGIAGAGREENIDAVHAEFNAAKASADDQLQAFPDMHIALEAAFSGGPGVILITGTGSGVFGKGTDGLFVKAGGWGARLGDLASGEQIGRRALRSVARALDGGASTALTQILAVELNFKDRKSIVEAVYDQNFPLASLAPFVLDAAARQDEIALEILRSEAMAMAEEARFVLDQLDESRIALIGGLVKNEAFRTVLERALLEEIHDVSVCDPDHTPEYGALRLAEERFGSAPDESLTA